MPATASGTSPKQQQANEQALREASRNIAAAIRAGYGPMPSARAMASVGLRVVSAVKVMLSEPGGGRTYTHRFWTDDQGRLRVGAPRVPHTASAPGKAPAVDTGLLRSSYTFEVGTSPGGAHVDVGTGVKYAPFLEFGTSRMRARPHLRPAIAKTHRAISKEITKEIGKSLTQAVKSMGGTIGGRLT